MTSLKSRCVAGLIALTIAGCGRESHQLNVRFAGMIRDGSGHPVHDAAVTVLSPLRVSGEDARADLPPPYRSAVLGRTDTEGRFDIASVQIYETQLFYPTWFVVAGTVYTIFGVCTVASILIPGAEEAAESILKGGGSRLACMCEYPCTPPHPSPLLVRVESPDGGSAAVQVDGPTHFTGMAGVVRKYEAGEIVVK
jgi:hypothetical protein